MPDLGSVRLPPLWSDSTVNAGAQASSSRTRPRQRARRLSRRFERSRSIQRGGADADEEEEEELVAFDRSRPLKNALRTRPSTIVGNGPASASWVWQSGALTCA